MGHQLLPKGRPMDLARNKGTHLETFRGSVFVIFQIVPKNKVHGIRLFFFEILRDLWRSRTRAHIQSVRACAVETHFPVFFFLFLQKTAPKRVRSGSILGTIFIESHNFARKKGCEKQRGKKCPTNGKLQPIILSLGSLTATLACALFQKETIV